MNDIEAIKEALAGCEIEDKEQINRQKQQSKSPDLEALVSETQKQTALLETIKNCVVIWTVLTGVGIIAAILSVFIAANI